MFDFFDFIKDFIFSGIYDFFSGLIEWALTKFIVGSIEMALWGLNMAWAVAQNVVDAFDMTTYISDAFGILPASMHGLATAMKLPEVVNVILTGIIGKFTLRFVPGL